MPVTDGEGQGQHRTRQAMLVAAGCSFVLGIATLLWPGRDASTLAMVFGMALLSSATVQAYLSVRAHIAFLLRVVVATSAGLTFVLAVLAFAGGHIELLALWIGLGWSVRGIVQALAGAWDDNATDGWLHELCGLGTCALGITVIAMKFETVAGLATVTGAGLLVIGALELLAGGLLRAVRGAQQPVSSDTAVAAGPAAPETR